MRDIELSDWSDYKAYLSSMIGGFQNYIFRGQADRAWKLESTLTRLLNRVSENIPASFLEEKQLNNFRTKARGLLRVSPSQLSENELWALGQHYGLCTPLLDWTESPYIAAYFAFADPRPSESGQKTIYVLDKLGLEQKLKESKISEVEFFEPIDSDNSRIVAQAGLFTKLPTKVDLESWLKDRNLEHFLRKIHIHESYRLDALNDLKLMNIVGSSIFPDLHGASISCNMWVETLSDNITEQEKIEAVFDKLSSSLKGESSLDEQ